MHSSTPPASSISDEQVPAKTKQLLPRIKELDGLRGIAILMVISFHYLNNQLENNHDKTSKIISKLTAYGWVGVDLFFVLSGFLIGSVLIANKNSPYFFKTFFIRRIVRIIPNYFLLLIVFVIIWSLPYFDRNTFLAVHEPVPVWSYFLMVHNFYIAHFQNFGNRALSVSWSIAIEEQFYLLFPFIVFFIRNKWLPYLLLFFVILAVVVRSLFTNWIPQYVLLPSRLDGLAIGFLIAYAHLGNIINANRLKVVRLLWALLVVVMCACAFLFWRYNDIGVIKHTLFATAFAAVLIFALVYPHTWYGSLLRNKILVWIGTISYSLYLFHYLILGLAYHISGKNGIKMQSFGDAVITIIAFACSLAISYLIYRVLELPMVRFGKKYRY